MNYNLQVNIMNLDYDELLAKCLVEHLLLKAYLEGIKIKFKFEKNKNIKALIKYIFMDEQNNFIRTMKEKMKNYGWLDLMVKKFIKLLSIFRTNFQQFYDSCCKLCGIYYEEIKQNFGVFLDESKKAKNNSIYSFLISFLAFCNDKENYLLVVKEISECEEIRQNEDNFKNNMQKKLSQIINNYCSYYEISICDKIVGKKEQFKEVLQNELNSFNCFVEICKPGEKLFQKFYKCLYNCIGNKLRNIYLRNCVEVNTFIDALFYILIVHFGLENYWKDEYMLNMYEQINESIIENSTLEGDSNYLDFALCYKYKYNVELKDFIIILIDGLKNEKLNEIFKLANEKIAIALVI